MLPTIEALTEHVQGPMADLQHDSAKVWSKPGLVLLLQSWLLRRLLEVGVQSLPGQHRDPVALKTKA